MALTSCCPICYKIGSLSNVNCESLKKRELVQQRFFKFFKRYLNDGNEEEESNIDKKRKQLHERGYPKLEKLSEVGLLPCQDCLTQMESFCNHKGHNLYDKFKATELLLNWRVWKVKNIMTGAQRVSSRIKSFREFIDKVEVEAGEGEHYLESGTDIISFIAKSRNTLIGKCLQKVKNVTPILSIARWEPGGQKVSTCCQMEGGESLNKVGSTNANPKSAIRPNPMLEDAATTSLTKECAKSPKALCMSVSPSLSVTEPDDSCFITDHHDGQFIKEDNDRHRSLDNISISGNKATQAIVEGNGTSLYFNRSVKLEADQEFEDESMPEPSAISEVHLDNVPSLHTESDEEIHGVLPVLNPAVVQNPPRNDNNGVDEPEDSFRWEPKASTESTFNIISKAPGTFNESQNSETTSSRLRPTLRCHKCGRTFSTRARFLSHEQEAHGDDDGSFSDLQSVLSEDGHGYMDMKGDSSSLSSSSSSSSADEADDDSDFQQDTEEESPIIKETETLEEPISEPLRQDIPSSTLQECVDLQHITSSGHKKVINQEAGTTDLNFTKTSTDPDPTIVGGTSCPNPGTSSDPGRHFRLKCPDCNLLFRDVKNLLIHRRESCRETYDPNATIKVEVMKGSSTNSKIQSKAYFVNLYAIIDIPQRMFPCENCDLVLYSSESLEAHKSLHGKFKCNFCQIELPYARNLALHELKHSRKTGKQEDKAFSHVNCPRCVVTFSNEHYDNHYVPHHLSQHMSLKWYGEPLCAICKTTPPTWTTRNIGKHFKTAHDLTDIIDPRDIVRCHISECDAYFLTLRQLSGHLNYHHKLGTEGQDGKKKSGRNIRLKCKDCDKSYFETNTLRNHRLKYHVPLEKVIPCPFKKCNLEFETKQQLESHLAFYMERHKGLDEPKVKEFVNCPVCNRRVSSSKSSFLKMHMQTHETSHVCEECGKQFKFRMDLKKHKLTHSGPESWQFSCSVCGKKYLDRRNLKYHMRSHTNERPYVCEICGLKYSHHHSLRIHVSKKHGDMLNDIPKNINSKSFTSKKGVKRKQIEDNDSSDDDDLSD